VAARFAPEVVPAQAGDQFAFQLAAGDHVNVAINRFVAGLHERHAGIISLEAAGNLLRRPAPAKPRVHFFAQRRVRFDGAIAPAAAPASGERGLVGRGGAIGGAATVQCEFAADRAGGALQPVRDGLLGVARA